MARRLSFATSLLGSVALVALGCEPKTSSSGSSGPTPPAPPVSSVDGGADPQTGVIRYLALGDSLSQGVGAPDIETGSFPSRLSERWRATGCKVELKNVGVSGNTTNDVISAQLPEIAPFKPTFITFQCGANDIANSMTVDEYRKNVKTILDAAKGSGARVVVLAQNEWFRAPQGPGYGGTPENRAAFDAVLIEETKAKGAEFVDLRLLHRQEADKNLWVDDGIHPTAAAYDAWAGELARVIPAPCGK